MNAGVGFASDLTHSRVVVRQGFGQLTGGQKLSAHLQVVLDLDVSRPEDAWNPKKKKKKEIKSCLQQWERGGDNVTVCQGF